MIDEFRITDFFHRSCEIPTTYSGGISLIEEVGKLETYVNSLYQEYLKTTNNLSALNSSYTSLVKLISEYKDTLNMFLHGYTIPDGSVTLEKLSSGIMEVFKGWINEYIYQMHSFVTFGLEGDYFVVYIPTTWKDITFDTDVEGRLVLEFI